MEKTSKWECGCGAAAVRIYKSAPACAGCIAIEAETERRLLNKQTRAELSQAQARYNETRTDAWKLRQTPPPRPPVDAVLAVGGYAQYFWRATGKMEVAW